MNDPFIVYVFILNTSSFTVIELISAIVVCTGEMIELFSLAGLILSR